MAEHTAFELTSKNVDQTYDGLRFDCPECNRRQFLARAVFGRLGGAPECDCGAEFRLLLEVSE